MAAFCSEMGQIPSEKKKGIFCLFLLLPQKHEHIATHLPAYFLAAVLKELFK